MIKSYSHTYYKESFCTDVTCLFADVREFDVTKTGLEYGLRSDQRTYIVQNLIPNLGYSFRVRAINDLGRGKLASKGSGMCSLLAVPNYWIWFSTLCKMNIQ